jgi:muramoyltetrapeptide carboxypeptidase LdcA involved in peptidoglycan recycling
MDVPIGHIDRNQPILLNAQARLTVTAYCATLSYL